MWQCWSLAASAAALEFDDRRWMEVGRELCTMSYHLAKDMEVGTYLEVGLIFFCGEQQRKTVQSWNLQLNIDTIESPKSDTKKPASGNSPPKMLFPPVVCLSRFSPVPGGERRPLQPDLVTFNSLIDACGPCLAPWIQSSRAVNVCRKAPGSNRGSWVIIMKSWWDQIGIKSIKPFLFYLTICCNACAAVNLRSLDRTFYE